MNFTPEEKQLSIINTILKAACNANTEEHFESLEQLYSYEENRVAFSEMLLDIMINYSVLLSNREHYEQLQIFIFIKNQLEKSSSISSMQNIPQIEVKIFTIMEMYFQEIVKGKQLESYFEQIISSLFDIIKNLENPTTFLTKIFKELIENSFSKISIVSFDFIAKVANFLEKFIGTFLLFCINENDLNFIVEFYNVLLGQCEIYSFKGHQLGNNLSEKANLFNQVILSFCKSSLQFLDYFMKNFIYSYQSFSNKTDYSSWFIENDSFLNFIQHSLMLSYNSKEQKNMNNVFILFLNPTFSNEWQNEFNLSILKEKGIIFELLTLIISKLIKQHIIESFPKFKTLITNISNPLVENLIISYKLNSIPKERIDNKISEINTISTTSKILMLLEIFCEFSYGVEVVSKYQFDLLRYVIIPNSSTSPLELYYFSKEEESENYVKNLIDTCNLCEERFLKQKSLKLLMGMCSNLDGFFNYVVELCIKVLNTLTKVNDTGSIPDNDEVFVDIISKYSEKELMDQSLQILTTISFLFPEKEKVYSYFEESIDMINHILIKLNDEILKTKLCMFYQYNLDDLFHDEKEILSKSFDDSLEFICNVVLQSNKKKVLVMIGINTYISIIFEKNLIKFCGTNVKIFANKLIDYLQADHLKCYEDDFLTLLKGILQYYSNEIERDISFLFNIFWEDFKNLVKISIDKKRKVRVALGEKNESDTNALSNSINIIHSFIKAIKNKDKAIKNNIYSVILTLTNSLQNFLNWDFEKEILDILILIMIDIKLLPNEYINQLISFLTVMNTGCDGVFEYNFESYHINFIFQYLSSLHREVISQKNIRVLLVDTLSCRLSYIPKKTPVNKIIAEHYIYADFCYVYIMLFYNEITTDEIKEILDLIFKRMETIPNANLDLNVKLCMSIFLLIFKMENYEILNNIDMGMLLIRITNFFPLRDLSQIEHEILVIAFCMLIRFIIVKENSFTFPNKEVFDIMLKMISLVIDELNFIKKCIDKASKKRVKKLNESQKNDKDDKISFKKGKNSYKYSERKNHLDNKILMVSSSKKLDEEFLEDYYEDIDSEESFSKSEGSESMKGVDENNPREFYNDDYEDKDDSFIHPKKENVFETYYKNFADQSLKAFIKEINEFQMFDIMLKDIEIANENFYKSLLEKLSKKKLEIIQNFREFKKIKIKTENDSDEFVYRKILKLKK